MKKALCLALLALMIAPSFARAQGAAPEMFGVREVILQYTRFTDAKASDTCGLSRDTIEATIVKAVQGTGVPLFSISEAKPPIIGVARIELIPEISTHTDENLDCVSWVSLSAESKANAQISPITTLRNVTVVYWRQKTVAASSQSTHPQNIAEVLRKMSLQFSQQFRLDQPPEIQQQMQQTIPQVQQIQQTPQIKYSR